MKEPWVKDLDFSEFEALPKSFLSDHYKEIESDLICKLKLNGKDFYFFVLLEFQSTIDRFMAVRMLNYITSFWLDLIAQKPKPKKLPPVFPVMLYNGSKKWTAPSNISDLVLGNELLGKFSINFEYHKILENQYSLKELLRIRNIVSTLFLAETHFDIKLLEQELNVVLKNEEDKVAIPLFFNWFKQLLNHERITEKDFDKVKQVYKNNQEAKEMLITSIKKQKQEWKKEGIKEEKLQIVRSLLQIGDSVEKVSLVTKLPMEEILKIQKEM